MQQVYEEVLEEARYSPGINYVDLKMMQSCYKQLALAGNLAKEENYHCRWESACFTLSLLPGVVYSSSFL